MPDTDATPLYQAYPHLRKIEELWGSAQGRALLIDLMEDTREGTRQGFKLEHASIIFSLLIEHDRLFPQFDDSRDRINPW